MSTDWRNHLAVHPACAAFPELSRDELIELGNDIRKHGLQSSIVVLRVKSKIDGRDEYQLLDGRSRLDAMAAIGIEFDFAQGNRRNGPHLHFLNGDFKGNSTIKVVSVEMSDDDEIRAFVASANLHRRHLKAEDKRAAIDALLKLDPGKSDRQIAKQTRSSPTTVGRQREKAESAGDVSRMDTRTDTKGRKQPARKPPKTTANPAAPAVEDGAEASAALRKQQYAADELAKITPAGTTTTSSVDLKKIAELVGQARSLLKHPTSSNVESVKALLTKITRLCEKPSVKTCTLEEKKLNLDQSLWPRALGLQKTDAEEPAPVEENINDIVGRQYAAARACHKVLKVSSPDKESREQIAHTIGGLISEWRSLQTALALPLPLPDFLRRAPSAPAEEKPAEEESPVVTAPADPIVPTPELAS